VLFLFIGIFILFCPIWSFGLHKWDFKIQQVENFSAVLGVNSITHNLDISDYGTGTHEFRPLILGAKINTPSKLLKCSKYINTCLFCKNIQKQLNAPVLHRIGLFCRCSILYSEVLLI